MNLVYIDLENITPDFAKLEKILNGIANFEVKKVITNDPKRKIAFGPQIEKYRYQLILTPTFEIRDQYVDTLIKETIEQDLQLFNNNIEFLAIVSNDNGFADMLSELRKRNIITWAIGNSQMGLQLKNSASAFETIDKNMNPRFIGIDLGTTNSVISQLTYGFDKQPTVEPIEMVINDFDGTSKMEKILPSAVRLQNDLQYDMGHNVVRESVAHAENTFINWKNDIGRNQKNGDPFFYRLNEKNIAPEFVASKVLHYCREQFKNKFKRDISKIVITHPASYEPDALNATRKAAELAGWKLDQVLLLPEPSAALYYFLHNVQRGHIVNGIDPQSQPFNVLVYDLGGGTLDVSLHNVTWNDSQKQFDISDIGVGSRTKVGGFRVDELLAGFILDRIKLRKNHNFSAEQEFKIKNELIVKLEEFKKTWNSEFINSNGSENFSKKFIHELSNGIPVREEITLKDFKQILEPLLASDLSLKIVEQLNLSSFHESELRDRFNTFIVPIIELLLKVKSSKGVIPPIDLVLLNGGLTKFKIIKDRLESFFENLTIDTSINPDLSVANGAALFAAEVIGKDNKRICPNNFYLEVNDAKTGKLDMLKLVSLGQPLPYETEVKDSLGINKLNDQSALAIRIYTGSGDRKNLGLSLMRSRFIPFTELSASGLLDCKLKLKVKLDERDNLSLIALKDGLLGDRGVEFKINDGIQEFNKEKLPSPPTKENLNQILSKLKPIQRFRTNKVDSAGTLILDFDQLWDEIRKEVPISGPKGLKLIIKSVSDRIIFAKNNFQLLDLLIQKIVAFSNPLPDDVVRYKHPLNIQYVSIRIVKEILEKYDTKHIGIKESEQRFKNYLLNNLPYYLTIIKGNLMEFGHFPGQLLWLDSEGKLKAMINTGGYNHTDSLLISFGKIATPTSDNLKFLINRIVNYSSITVKRPAIWALIRLLSSKQPTQYLAKVENVIYVLNQIKSHLVSREIEPKYAISLVDVIIFGLALVKTHGNYEHLIFKEFTKLNASSFKVYPFLDESNKREMDSKFKMINEICNDKIVDKQFYISYFTKLVED